MTIYAYIFDRCLSSSRILLSSRWQQESQEKEKVTRLQPPSPSTSQSSRQPSSSSTSQEESPRTLKRKLEDAKDEIENLKKRLNRERVKSCRLKKKVNSLEEIIDSLKENNLVSDSCADTLGGTIQGIPKELVSRLLNAKKGKVSNIRYSKELKAFAVTLHFYSPKAYRYARKSLGLALPHPDHLRKPQFVQKQIKQLPEQG